MQSRKRFLEKETQIDEKRKALGARMSSNLKAGPAGALEMTLSFRKALRSSL